MRPAGTPRSSVPAAGRSALALRELRGVDDTPIAPQQHGLALALMWHLEGLKIQPQSA